MSEKKTCFIIRPFSEPFDTRSETVYKPAIIKAGLVPVEAGVPGDNKITDKIEESIRNAVICLADLTLIPKKDSRDRVVHVHNPNVWYELGFAFAHHGQAVMVYNVDVHTMSALPFDISHRFVNEYTNLVDSNKHALKGVATSITEDLLKKLERVPDSVARSGEEQTHASTADKEAVLSEAAPHVSLTSCEIMVLNALLIEDGYIMPHRLKEAVLANPEHNHSDAEYALALNKLRMAKLVIEDSNAIFIEDLAGTVPGIAISNAGKLWCEKHRHIIIEVNSW